MSVLRSRSNWLSAATDSLQLYYYLQGKANKLIIVMTTKTIVMTIKTIVS